MRCSLVARVGVVLLSAGLVSVSGAYAQKAPLPTPQVKTITPAQLEEMRNTAPVDWRDSYKHGRYLFVTLKNNDKIAGRIVWTDEKAGKLYIRPRDGLTPVGVPFADISKTERIQLAANKKDKGGIAPAVIKDGGRVGPAIVAPEVDDTAEIHVIRIRNGASYTEHYFSTSLSPSEEEHLRKLEQLSRDIAQNQQLIDGLDDMMRNKQKLQEEVAEQAKAQTTYLKTLNNTFRNYSFISSIQPDPPLGLMPGTSMRVNNTFPGAFNTFNPLTNGLINPGSLNTGLGNLGGVVNGGAAVNGLLGLGALGTLGSLFNPFNNFGGNFYDPFGYGYNQDMATVAYLNSRNRQLFYTPPPPPQYPVFPRVQDDFTPGQFAEQLELTRKSLERTQHELTMARNRLIYEDGRVVAVRLD